MLNFSEVIFIMKQGKRKVVSNLAFCIKSVWAHDLSLNCVFLGSFLYNCEVHLPKYCNCDGSIVTSRKKGGEIQALFCPCYFDDVRDMLVYDNQIKASKCFYHIWKSLKRKQTQLFILISKSPADWSHCLGFLQFACTFRAFGIYSQKCIRWIDNLSNK